MTALPKTIPHSFNGTSIEQRKVDGYINGTAMCLAHGKDIANWLKTDDTWELTQALASDLSIEIKSSKKTNSEKTRVSASFPSLVVSRKGSPENGGGTWIHPDLAVQLAQWCNKSFAIQVSRWIQAWVLSVYNPIQLEADADRVRMRDKLKNDKRLALTNQIKNFLEMAGQYQPGSFHTRLMFSQAHDRLNRIITGETSQQMKVRLSSEIGKQVSDHELIRDYFPIDVLADFGSLCQAAANEMSRNGTEPLEAIEIAAHQVLPQGYVPQPIDFTERISLVRRRLMERDQLQLVSA